jgi:hypothetical protein
MLPSSRVTEKPLLAAISTVEIFADGFERAIEIQVHLRYS